MKRVVIVSGVLSILATVVFFSLPASVSNVQANADKFRKAERSVPEQYIVVLEDWAVRSGTEGRSRVREVAGELAAAYQGSVFFTYEHAINGFAVRMTEGRAIALSNDPRVKYVEEDGVAEKIGTQSGATWGIDRIDERDLPLDGLYYYGADGTGVRAYIIDTGILASHTEFGGRVVTGYSAIAGGTSDCNGHGTHVAGTVGGTTYGVAKNVTLIPVRVLDCSGSGTWSGVVSGIDWVTNEKKSSPGVPMVANMSLGGGYSSTVNNAVTNSVAAGVVHAVAAGNSNANACNYSPASTPNAMTVGATTSSDARASYSNFGSCLDIFAPGSSITSAWYTSSTATNTISGTSMASPHVAGAAALALQAYPASSPAQIMDLLRTSATTGKVTSAGTGSPNLLLHSATFVADGNLPPTADFTFSCSGLTCTFDGSSSSDAEGAIAAYSWSFGSTESTATITYLSNGLYNITLTVTDSGGKTASVTKAVSAFQIGAGINLSVTVSKKRSLKTANLSWSGISGTSVVYRNDVQIGTATGTTFSNSLGSGSGTVSYRVCSAATSSCSAAVSTAY